MIRFHTPGGTHFDRHTDAVPRAGDTVLDHYDAEGHLRPTPQQYTVAEVVWDNFQPPSDSGLKAFVHLTKVKPRRRRHG